MEEKEVTNPYEYTYDKDQLIGINAMGLLSMMGFLEQVIEKEPKIAALLVYPGQTTEIKDDKGNLVKVEIDWKDHNADSFFFTAADKDGGIPIMTEIAMKASQLLRAFTLLHQENINNNIAKKVETRNDESVFRA
jgi:hypothetical protein